VEGWDPVTGLGTPDYGKLLKAFMALKWPAFDWSMDIS
jgi:hypothetical protein